MNAPLSPAQKIALLNDAFRQSVSFPLMGKPPVPGIVVVTAGIGALTIPQQVWVIKAIRSFDGFSPDNDPWGEHDFGAIELPDIGKVFWKIDLYDTQECRFMCEAPDDPKNSFRVLTIMLAEEY